MFVLRDLRGLMPLWKNAQQPMQQVVRWGNFPNYGQSLLMHSNSFPLLGRMVVIELVGQGVKCDEVLLMDAFILHDHGEPPTGGDEHDGNKTADKPLREWAAFWEMTSRLPPSVRQHWRRAFALQYCRKKDWDKIPLKLNRNLVPELCLSHSLEAGVFEFCERLDYLMSALAGQADGVRNDEETMIEHTVTRQVPKLDALVEEFDCLGLLWTPALRSSFLALSA